MAPRGKGPPSDGVLKAPEPQTDLDQTQVTENTAVNSAVNTPDSQTDPIMKVQPRKRVSARDILPSADKDISEAEAAVEPTTRTRIKMEAPMPNTEILAIDDELGVQTELEKARDKFLDLIESLKTGRYLTDRIQGVEKHSDGGMPRAVIYHGDYKVILMASMVVDLPRDLRDRTPNEMYLYMLQKRLGSEIDYVVKGIDQNTGMAVASRKEAMATKRRHYYLNLTREGTFRVYEGLVCETRVISVIPDGIFVELFGIDVYIPLRELSHTRIPDAMGYFEPGDRILVKITKLDRSDPKDIYVAASVKQVATNPTEKALEKIDVGGNYAGTVTMIDQTGIFVQLDMGAECKCKFPLRARPPIDARVIVAIDGVSMETKSVWGKITYVTIPK
ncbi:MAG: S1 RNA-binding domain-containing protein [Oscillospiraceae bacterium]|nr:S1 RNA-binding domain-containing protein [Oscillospiraceae bacterium]